MDESHQIGGPDFNARRGYAPSRPGSAFDGRTNGWALYPSRPGALETHGYSPSTTPLSQATNNTAFSGSLGHPMAQPMLIQGRTAGARSSPAVADIGVDTPAHPWNSRVSTLLSFTELFNDPSVA
jgi:hypothetical protein